MEHIKHILAARKASLFAARGGIGEKGSREWSAFNSVRGDTIDTFPVATPIKRQPRYANIVHINRHPVRRQLSFGGM